MTMFPHGETVVRQRATSADNPYSGEAGDTDWTTPGLLTITGCAFDPGGSLEPTEQGRTAVITQPTLYAPPNSDVLAGDRLVVRGRTWDVDGDPADWRSPFTGWEPGMAIKLKAVEG